MNIKKNKRFLIIPCVLIIVASICLIQIGFGSSITKGTTADEAEIENIIKEMILVKREVGSYTSATGKLSDLSDEDKRIMIEDYQQKLQTVFTRESNSISKFMEIRTNILSDSTQRISNVVDNGIFELVFNSLTVKSDKARAEISTISWQKYIAQRDEDEKFVILFPKTGKDWWDVSLERQEGVWKVVNYSIKFKESKEEDDSWKIFDTYAEALAYAEKTEPWNIYASE